MEKVNIKEVFRGEEVSLRDLLMIFIERKKIFLYAMGIFLILGVIFTWSSDFYYQSSSTYLSESGGGGNAPSSSGLASLLGITGGEGSSSSGNFRDPSFYPSILYSRPFLLELMKERFYFSIYNDTLSLQQFVNGYDENKLYSDYIRPIIKYPRSLLPGEKNKAKVDVDKFDNQRTSKSGEEVVSPIQKLSRAQIRALENLSQRLSITTNGNLVRVSVIMPDPYVSAELNEFVSRKLLNFIILHETEKERRDLDFVRRRVVSAKAKFEESQQALAQFQDKNQKMVLATAKAQEEQLKSAYSIDFDIYKQLAKELEEKELALEEKTPVFTVFEPVYVPIEPANTSSGMNIIAFIALGFFVAGAWVVVIIVKALIVRE